MSFYSGAKRIVSPLIKLTLRIKVTGAENLPAEGGYVVCANHTSLLDVLALGASLKRLLRYMAKMELFKFKPFGWLLKKVGAFPVDRSKGDIGAIKTALSFVGQGELVCIFPQGTRIMKKDPATTKVKSGAGMICAHAKCGAVPVFIKSKNNHLHFFGRNEIIIGKPIAYKDFGFDGNNRKEYDRATRMIFHEVCALGGYDFPIAPPAKKQTQE